MGFSSGASRNEVCLLLGSLGCQNLQLLFALVVACQATGFSHGEEVSGRLVHSGNHKEAEGSPPPPSPFPYPRYDFFSLETRLLMLVTRRCPKLKILTSLLFSPAFSCLHSFGVFPDPQVLYVLFKTDFPARGDSQGKISFGFSV